MDNPLNDPKNQQFYRQDEENMDHEKDREHFGETIGDFEENVAAGPKEPKGRISDRSGGDVDIDQLQKELNDALQQAEENLNGWKRTQADLENFRRRKEAESSEWILFGKQAAFVQILPILDSLEQAIVHAPQMEDEKFKQWKAGLDGIVKQINDAIVKMGIEKVETAGKRFDPNTMEAVREVDGEEDGMVAEQYQTGYMMSGKVLRPAQVAITKKGTL